MQIRCLIIDDEPLSQDVIEDYINACPELTLAGICNNAIDALAWLNSNTADVLFLDINMPRLSGISFAKSLANPPLVVLITAYPEFALDGFEIDAVDYLVKPVPFERFRIAVNRVLERVNNLPGKTSGHIMVRADKKDYCIKFSELLFLEAQGDYVRFITEKKALMVHGTLKEFLKLLPSKQFIRIHKSYVIALSKVEYIDGNQVKIGADKLPVSLTYKEELLGRLNP